MKKIISLFSAAVIISTLVSCGETKKPEEVIVAPQGMIVLDLTKYGKPFVIFVPASMLVMISPHPQAKMLFPLSILYRAPPPWIFPSCRALPVHCQTSHRQTHADDDGLTYHLCF